MGMLMLMYMMIVHGMLVMMKVVVLNEGRTRGVRSTNRSLGIIILPPSLNLFVAIQMVVMLCR